MVDLLVYTNHRMGDMYYNRTFNIAYHDVTGLKCIQVIYAIVSRTIRLPTQGTEHRHSHNH